MNELAGRTKPNVLIFMTDQQTGATIQDGANARAITPHLDKFRQRAVTFNNAFAPSPHCCPSRTSFFTGLYPSQHGVWNNVNVPNALSRGPRADTRFWSTDLAAAGYDLAFSGKWHVSNFQRPADFGWRELMVTSTGSGAGLSPEAQQADARAQAMALVEGLSASVAEARGPGEILRPGWPAYTHFGTDENPFGDADVVQKGVDYIHAYPKADGAEPFCLYVGTLGPHDPYTPPQEYLDWYDPDDIALPASFDDPMADKPGLYTRTRDKFDQLSVAEHKETLQHYLAFCSYEDALFGQLLSALEETGQADNTIIIFTSDHGDYVGEHGLWCKGLPAFQSAYNVPLVISGPGVCENLRGHETDNPISLVDVGPTLLDLCAVSSAASMSGVSVCPWLSGVSEVVAPRDMVFQTNGNEAYGIQRTIVSGDWKLVYNMFDHDELYNLAEDPDEMINLLPASRGERQVGRGALDGVPVELRDRLADLYRRLWCFGLAHDDDNINGYIMTALAGFGPGVASDNPHQK